MLVGRLQFVGLLAAFLSLNMSAMVGCQSQPTGDTVSTVAAGGVLKLKGAPLANHQVTLLSADKRPATGTSDAEGKFTLGTNKPGDGAPVGKYTVVVTYVGPPDHDPEKGAPPPPKVKIPAKYSDKNKSDLQVEVAASGATALAIDLK